MKIAVISDIHGNSEALEAVLDDIKENECEKIFCLGDYAMAGPEPKEVIERFIKMTNNSNIKMIQGNTDNMIAEYTEALYDNLKEKAPVMAAALRNDSEIISHEQKTFLKNLPSQMKIEEEGVKILLVHGSPRKNNENIFPDTPLPELEKMLGGVDADLVLCGHTHVPCGFQTSNSKTVVNVGSVGRPFTQNPDACYLILTLNNGKILFEHRLINYNRELSSEKMSKRSFEGADKLAQMLLEPTVRHF